MVTRWPHWYWCKIACFFNVILNLQGNLVPLFPATTTILVKPTTISSSRKKGNKKTAADPKAVSLHAGIADAGKEEITNTTEFGIIFSLLNNRYNIDFTSYKPNTINRRILRRMKLHKINDTDRYIHMLQQDTDELDMLYQDLLINVTNFFREPALYRKFTKTIFPALLKDRSSDEPIRIWIPACSSGEEACSMAITLFEYLGNKALTTPINIFATDLNETVIKKARIGIYSKNIVEHVPAAILNKYFIKVDGSYQVIKAIRDVCIYAAHNLLNDPPFSKMDIISCQNVMIYLEQAAQQRILQSFHYALNPAGFLVLGKSEGINSATDLFVPSHKGQRIFTRTASLSNLKFEFSKRPADLLHGTQSNNKMIRSGLTNESDLTKEIDKILLSRFAPASILINRDLQIVRFTGDTSPFLQPASGKASLGLLKMVKDEIVFELRSLLNKIKKTDTAVKKEGIPITINKMLCELSVEVVPVKSTADYYLIVFQCRPIPAAPASKKSGIIAGQQNRVVQLESQLRESKEHLKIMTEEFNAIQEQLQTANEEVLSSNEELQSINEELETSKEELQSTNEELTTINEELQRRNEELDISVKYAQSIIETIREPLLVLDTNMKVEKVNRSFLHLFGLKTEQVYQNHLYDLGNGQFDIKILKDKLRRVISESKSFEDFEVEASFGTDASRILSFNALCINHENKANNKYLLVIEDITIRRNAENLLKANEERLKLIIQNAFDIVTIFSEKGNIIYESESIKDILGYEASERIGKNVYTDSIVHPDDKHIKEQMFKDAKNNPGKNVRSEFRLLHKNGSYRIMEAVCINMLHDFRIKGLIANYHDVTDRRMLEKQKDQFIGIASHELKTPVTTIKGYAQLLQEIFSENGDGTSVNMVKKMNGQINRLSNLIKDLLDTTQIEEGQLKFKKNKLDINKLIKEVKNELQPIATKHRIEEELEEVGIITTDKERIRQVLSNLISNAIKYSPQADKILIRSKKEKDGVVVSVKDYGIGISEENQSMIFDRFFRGLYPGTNTYPGLGLGLYIAAEIVKKAKGKIWVTSKKNKGSEFSFFLPYNHS